MLEFVPVKLDFESSGQGVVDATELRSDGHRLSNAIELLRPEGDLLQVELCRACGIQGCENGGWVALRRVGDSVAWVPAFDAMTSDEFCAMERYAPPSFLAKTGLFGFASSEWQDLRERNQSLPAAGSLKPLSNREALSVIQLTAPRRLLGPPAGPPILRRSAILASSEGDLQGQLDLLESAASWLASADGDAELFSSDSAPDVSEFWVDLPGTPAWRQLAIVKGVRCLQLGLCRWVVAGTRANNGLQQSG